MKVFYIAETSLTNKSAYTHHVLKMCDALSKKGNVQLIIPYFNKNLNFKKIKKFLSVNELKKMIKKI